MIINTTKLDKFNISKKSDRFLMWTLVAYLIIEAIVETGNYLGVVNRADGSVVYGFSRFSQSRVGEIILSFLSTGTLLILWEYLRRSLKQVKSILWYLVLAIMTLVACDFLVSLIPDGSGSIMDEVHQASRLDNFSSSFRSVSGLVQSIIGLVLSVSFIAKYRGRIRTYGWISIVCPLAWGVLMGLSFSYMVDNASSFVDNGLSVLTVVLRYIFGIVPFVFMKRMMIYDPVQKSDDSDLSHLNK